MLEIDFFQLTDVGPVRTGNEDAVAVWSHDDGLVFAVADGLGGHASGEVASNLALEVIERETTQAPRAWQVSKRLRRAVQEANLALHGKSIAVPELAGMATTLTATAILGDTLTTAHVGDSRLYLVRDGGITQLTKDHTWVAEQIQYGLLSPEAAKTHPRRHSITRCLGTELIVGIDILTYTVQPGDALVQCSDGVHGPLEERAIAAAVSETPPNLACRRLVQEAVDAGGEDNLSVQVAVVTACSPLAAPPRRWWQRGR
jgi:serine/threonine protein phosphatase PrpC